MVKYKLPKLKLRVRFSLSAPLGNLSELFKSLDFNTKKYQFQKEVGTFLMLKERIDLK